MVGIDISDRSIKVAEVVGGKNPKIRTVCWSALPANAMRRGIIQDRQIVTLAIREAFRKCLPSPVEGSQVTASIPETQSFVRVLDLPAMSARELDEAVQWAVRPHIPFDLDRVYLDWQPLSSLGRQRARRQVLVGAAQRDVVDPLLQVFDELELNVVAFELEAQAIVRSLLPLDSQDVQGVLIVDLGATVTNVIFFDQGTMRFTTSVQLGGDDLTKELVEALHLQPALAAEQKALVGVGATAADPQVAGPLREAAQKLIERVERVVREMTAQAQTESPIRAIVLAGGSANLPGIVELFAQVFPGVPVQMGNPLANFVNDEEKSDVPLSKQDALHFTTALGLALRQPEYLTSNA